MSTSNTPAPYFPVPPNEYDQKYFREVLRAFSIFIQEQRNPGPLRATRITLTDLPTSATGLEPGTLWNDSGTVKVAT